MYPVIGDGTSPAWNPSRSGLEAAVAAALFANPYSAWLTDELGTSDFAQLLYLPDEWLASSPPDDLPLARHFPNSGYVVMRDSWDSAHNTLMTFKSSSFYSFNHHHRDENAFTIFYRAPLAIDSGYYDSYGDEHWYNYYTRSIAHNTVLIYDPDEKFIGKKGTIISNDGGQWVANNVEPSFDQMTQDGKYNFDGIEKYENHDAFTYSVGNATKAYSPEKLDRYERSVVYIRNHSYTHPLILIHDRVVSTNRDLKKTYLLHSIAKPTVDGNTVNISMTALPAPMAGMHQETILPKEPSIDIIGGKGWEFFVQDDGHDNPRNYRIDGNNGDVGDENIRRSRLEAGEWRVEISPSGPAIDDTFLHAISVVDTPHLNAGTEAQYLKGANIDGVLINDADGKEKSLVLFQRDAGELVSDIPLPRSAEFDQVIIVGLDPETALNIRESGSSLYIRSDSNGDFFSSKAGTLFLQRNSIHITQGGDSLSNPQ